MHRDAVLVHPGLTALPRVWRDLMRGGALEHSEDWGHDARVPLSDWLQVADGPATPSQQALLDELGLLLDEIQPVALDRSRSRLRWTPAEYDRTEVAAEVTLLHLRRVDWSVTISAAPRSATVSWLTAHDHFDDTDGWEDYPWTSVVVDTVAGILRGVYEVEEITRLGRWYMTRILDVSDRDNPQWLRSSGPLWFWFLRPFPATAIRRRIDFTSL